jgi:TATA element modulatory factor
MTELRSSQLSSELSQRQMLSHELEEKQQEIYRLQLTHQRELEELRCQFSAAAESSSNREEVLRRDHSTLLKKLQAAEARADEFAQCTSDSTKPLLRQLEALQSSASSQQQMAERTERQLLDKVAELTAKLTSVSEQERVGRDTRASLEKQVRSLGLEMAQMQSAVKDLEKQKKAIETDREK